MTVEKLQRWHLDMLADQGVAEARPPLSYFDATIASGPAYAGYTREGVVTCMGLILIAPGVYRCWALTDPVLASKHFLAVNKAMRAFLVEHPFPRIETVVLVGNVAGHRWCTELHGFQAEGIMRNWDAGADAMLYSRINR